MHQVVKEVSSEYVDDTGTVETANREATTTTDRFTAINVVMYIVGIIETLLAARLILKLLGANSGSGFVQFIYNITGILTAPFDRIFGVSSTVAGQTRSVFEPSILVAMIVYALIGYGISRLLTIDKKPVE